MGKDEPIVSMDATGKTIFIKQTEVSAVNIRNADPALLVDGERIPLAVKELGHTETYAQAISHSPNGRFVAVTGEGQFVIYTALAWRNKSFGAADEVRENAFLLLMQEREDGQGDGFVAPPSGRK